MDPRIHYQPFVDKYAGILDCTKDHPNIQIEQYEEMCKASLNYLCHILLISRSLDKKFVLTSPFGDLNIVRFLDFLFNISEMTVIFSLPVRMEALNVFTRYVRRIGTGGPDYFKSSVFSYFTRLRCKIEKLNTPHREKYIEVLSKIAFDAQLQEQLSEIISINMGNFQNLNDADQHAILSAILEVKPPKHDLNKMLKNIYPYVKQKGDTKLGLLFYRALAHAHINNSEMQIQIMNKFITFMKNKTDQEFVNTTLKCILAVMRNCEDAHQLGRQTLLELLNNRSLNIGLDSIYLTLCKDVAITKDREIVHDLFSLGMSHIISNKQKSLKRVFKGVCILGLVFKEFTKIIANFCHECILNNYNFPALAFDVEKASLEAIQPMPIKKKPDIFENTIVSKSDIYKSDIHIILKNNSDLRGVFSVLGDLKLTDREIAFREIGELYYVPQNPPAYADTVAAYVMLVSNYKKLSREFTPLFTAAVADHNSNGRRRCSRKTLSELLGNFNRVIYYLHFNACLLNPDLLSYQEGQVALREIIDNQDALVLSNSKRLQR